MKPSNPMRLARATAFLFMLLFLNGCYQYRLFEKDQSTATLPQSKLVCAYLWGIRSPSIEVATCYGNGFDRIVVKTNFVNSLVSIVTLGIVSPMRIYWECGKDEPEDVDNTSSTK